MKKTKTFITKEDVHETTKVSELFGSHKPSECIRDCHFSLAGWVIITNTVAYSCPCECHKRGSD